ncbi:hypothetical protein AVEN_199200-1 [Araneus ventricosus]|uniref:Uncharacterized protein n=1 Tax=Araneus ventricosus TaxID=182803 RepID=A0A4Y2L0G0_ARAVE|nr:hypothetical protein AVEN_32287-1 [Araneus ventricosus]GBN08102.1 hypothetical protein AVEN_199200-1 [Araneus ventricosus]
MAILAARSEYVHHKRTQCLSDLSPKLRFIPNYHCVCGDEDDPGHYAKDCHETKIFYFVKPSVGNLLAWCENVVKNAGSLVQLSTK